MKDMRTSGSARADESPRANDSRRTATLDFRALFEATPGLYLVLAADPPRFTMLAASDERLIGTMSTREATVGRGVFDVFSDANPDNLGRTGVANLRASLETVLLTRAPHRMGIQRYDLKRPDGRWDVRYWKQINSPVLGPGGEVRYIIHHVEDVTTEVAAEAAAEAARERIATTLESIGQAFYAVDADFRLTYVNRQAEQWWGRSRETLLGRHFWSEFPRTVGSESYRMHLQVMAERRPVHFETISPILGRWMDVSIYPEARGGGLACYFRDISERKHAEQDRAFLLDLAAALQRPPDASEVTIEATRRLGEYLGTLGCAFSDVDIERGVLHMRPGYVRAGGITPEAVYALPSVGRNWQSEMQAGEPYVVADAATDPRTIGEPYDRYHAPVGTRSFLIVPLIRTGRWRATLGVWDDQPREWTDHELTLVREVAARVWPALENARLVADARAARAEAEQRARDLEDSNIELVRLAAEAEAANRAKSDFLAVMSHELRTPLNAILGYVRIVQMGLHGPVTDGQKAALEKVVNNQTRLLSLITDILDYAKLESGRLRLAAANVDARVVLEGLENAILPQAHAKGIRYECQAGCDGIILRADPARTQQILLNLVSNAVKFTDPGGTIEVWCEAIGRRAAIHVRDTGRGIPANKLEGIFEPFVQVDAKLSRTQEGVGLGLAISRDLARGMGGDLTVESVEGVGSTFTLVLPRPDQFAVRAIEADDLPTRR